MKNDALDITYLLVFIVLFIASCNGQEQLKSSKETQGVNTDFSFLETQHRNAVAQIGEYFPDLLQDSKGNIWFATAFSGLARFDGDSLTCFSITDGLPHNTILDITEDKAGNIWFATRDGVSKYDGKIFKNYTKENGLSSNWTSSIFADSQGTIWVGTKKGVSRFDGISFSLFDIPKPDHINYGLSTNLVIRIIEDKKGNIWFGREDYGVCKYDGKTFTHFTEKDGLYSNSIKSILEDKNGNMWFGALETVLSSMVINVGGLCRYDGNSFTKFPEIEGLNGHEVWDLKEDKNGNIWIAPKNRGLYLYDGSKFSLVEGSMNLTPYSCVQSILEDKEGKMWFGYSGGIFRLDGKSFVNVKKNGPWK